MQYMNHLQAYDYQKSLSYRYIGRLASDKNSQSATVYFDRKLDIVPNVVNEDVKLLGKAFLKLWVYDEQVTSIIFVQI